MITRNNKPYNYTFEQITFNRKPTKKKELPKQIMEYTNNIDFDESIQCWNANKLKKKNGIYKYKCGKIVNDKPCRCQCVDKIGFYSGCKKHYMWEEKENKYIYDTNEDAMSCLKKNSSILIPFGLIGF